MKVRWNLIKWVLAVIVCAVSCCASTAGVAWRVYVGGYNTDESFGINYFSYDPGTAALTPLGLAVPTDNPSYLAANEDGTALYCVNETASFEGAGTVSAFSVNPETGLLREISKQSSKGTYPCHLSVDKKGKKLVVANYGSGSLVVFPLDSKTGSMGASTAFFQYTGASVNKGRQAGPHAHCAAFEPGYRYLYCCDLGTDKIMTYEVNRAGVPLTLSSTPFAEANPGSGPRHIAFHPDKPFAYVLNELDNSVTYYQITIDSILWRQIKKKALHSDGKLEKIESWSALPPDFEGQSTAAAIRIHPNGKFLYTSNRGDDSIAVFAINQKTGMLNPLAFVPSGGKGPRDFAIHPDGKSLVVANEGSGELVTFLLNPQTGDLTRSSQEPVKNARPTCVIFVPYREK